VDGYAMPINYEALLNDEEFLNMLSFRGVLREQSTLKKEIVSRQTADVIFLIEKELQN